MTVFLALGRALLLDFVSGLELAQLFDGDPRFAVEERTHTTDLPVELPRDAVEVALPVVLDAGRERCPHQILRFNLNRHRTLLGRLVRNFGHPLLQSVRVRAPVGEEEAPERFRTLACEHIGAIARRLAANVIEQRLKAALAAEQDNELATAEENTASPVTPSQARVAGREAGHPLGRTH